MRKCLNCRISGDEESFYTTGKWCKLCVDAFVVSKHQSRKDRLRFQRRERGERAIRILVKQLQAGRPYIYLIHGPSGYKIGFSKDVSRRAAQLNTAMGSSCSIVAIAPGGRNLERDMHKRHRFKRINREWFEPNPQILDDFTQLAGSFVFLPGHMTS